MAKVVLIMMERVEEKGVKEVMVGLGPSRLEVVVRRERNGWRGEAKAERLTRYTHP
jgi:hypothetical protein